MSVRGAAVGIVAATTATRPPCEYCNNSGYTQRPAYRSGTLVSGPGMRLRCYGCDAWGRKLRAETARLAAAFGRCMLICYRAENAGDPVKG